MASENTHADQSVTNASRLDNPEEREAYVVRARLEDVAMKPQAEEQPAAPPPTLPQPPQKSRRGLMLGLMFLLLLAAVISAILAVSALRAEAEARQLAQDALQERDQTRKGKAQAEQQRDAATAAQQEATREVDVALAAQKAARDQAENARGVLAFLQDKMFSVGRPKAWAGPHNKNVTLRKAVDAAERQVNLVLADKPLIEASVREILGATYLDLGETQRAIKEYRRALALRSALLGPDAADTARVRNQLAVALRIAGRTDEASQLYTENWDTPAYADALAAQATLLLAQHHPDAAELKLRESLAIRKRLQPDNWTTFTNQSQLGEALLDQKKYTQAEPLLLSGYEGLKKREASIPRQGRAQLLTALQRLVRLYQAWDKTDEAARWQKELAAARAAKKT